MIFKDKNSKTALRSFTRLIKDVLKEGTSGKSGLVFASTHTINTRLELYGGSRIVDILKALLPTQISFVWLLPPPTKVWPAYRPQHITGILGLLDSGIYPFFDNNVHSKFVLSWSIRNNAETLSHHCYFGSTNFTINGLINNIEEFCCTRSDDAYRGCSSRDQDYLLCKALEFIDKTNELYEDKQKFIKYGSAILKSITSGSNNIKKSLEKAKNTIDRLKVAMSAYECFFGVLASLWNAPGKQFAYTIGEDSLKAVDSEAGSSLESLREILGLKKEDVLMYTERFGKEIKFYYQIPGRVSEELAKIRGHVQDYQKAGYRNFLLEHEGEFIETLKRAETNTVPFRRSTEKTNVI